ncbi:hypothetical protein Tco_0120809 [Tanacetum coccineum]
MRCGTTKHDCYHLLVEDERLFLKLSRVSVSLFYPAEQIRCFDPSSFKTLHMLQVNLLVCIHKDISLVWRPQSSDEHQLHVLLCHDDN